MSADEPDFGPEGGAYDMPRPDASNGGNSDARAPLKLLTVRELFERPTPPWAIKKVFRKGALVVLYAPPDSCKTFIALDMILSIAAGLPWCGYQTSVGSVVYLAGEGADGFKKRLAAWGIHSGTETLDLNVRVLDSALELLNEAEFQRLLDALNTLTEKPLIIVVDTLARYLIGGEENSAKDMGGFVGRCGQLRDATGAAVIVVHHTGKNMKNERGSSALRGAADVMLAIQPVGNTIELTGDKCKDDLPLPPIYFRKKIIPLWNDEDGELLTSLVMQPCEAPPEAQQDDGPPASGAESVPHGEPEAAPDHGSKIRDALATLFNGRAAGSTLLRACGIKSSTFYAALKEEIEAQRIARVDASRYPEYELTDKAPEYRSPSPTPSPKGDLESDSDTEQAQGNRESESESDTHPVGVSSASESESRVEGAVRRPQQKKKKKKKTRSTKPPSTRSKNLRADGAARGIGGAAAAEAVS